MKFQYVVLTLGLLISSSAFALENDRFPDKEIQFSKNRLTLQQALDELNRLPQVSVVYNSNNDFLSLTFNLRKNTLNIEESLAEIKRQVPIEVIMNNNHIVIKSRELQES